MDKLLIIIAALTAGYLIARDSDEPPKPSEATAAEVGTDCPCEVCTCDPCRCETEATPFVPVSAPQSCGPLGCPAVAPAAKVSGGSCASGNCGTSTRGYASGTSRFRLFRGGGRLFGGRR